MQEKFFGDGLYSVTDNGEVYSYKTGHREIMAGAFTCSGNKYRVVTIYYKNGHRNEYVHRLVANAFLPNPLHLPQINHIDGNTKNNKVTNLEWCTPSHNTKHSYDIGLHKKIQCSICGDEYFESGSGRLICGKCATRILNSVDSALRSARKNEYYSRLLIISGRPDIVPECLALKAAGLTFQEIAKKYGLSKQRIHQLISSWTIEQFN